MAQEDGAPKRVSPTVPFGPFDFTSLVWPPRDIFTFVSRFLRRLPARPKAA